VGIDPTTLSLIAGALDARAALIGEPHDSALRLFNGFYEGAPDLVLDLYARTLVIHQYASPESLPDAEIDLLIEKVLGKLPWIKAAVLKPRRTATEGERRGKLVFGEAADRQVKENGVSYAIDLMLSQDTSLYLDTRNVRLWAIASLSGKTALNAFAYTGSYGVAALAGGARRVVSLDASRRFLELAKDSCTLNGIPVHKEDFLAGDFYVWVSRLKRLGSRFDCVFLDPPYFAQNRQGTIDMFKHSDRLVNKTRPLIADGGLLVLVNNAVFLSGGEFLQTIESLCAGGYLALETIIPVPEDVTGYSGTHLSGLPVDPAPFNHPTKIVILRVRRKG
jgi:23S rRNA (cytosine1962-C5)-methyltransferase